MLTEAFTSMTRQFCAINIENMYSVYHIYHKKNIQDQPVYPSAVIQLVLTHFQRLR